MVDLCKLFGSAETLIQDLTTSDGTSIWAGDGVHLTSPAYRVASRLLMAELEKADIVEAGEPALKRARLESVIPAPAPPPVKKASQLPAAETNGTATLAVRPITVAPGLQQPGPSAGRLSRMGERRRWTRQELTADGNAYPCESNQKCKVYITVIKSELHRNKILSLRPNCSFKNGE